MPFLRNAPSYGPAAPAVARRRILVTGAAGKIGRYFVHHAPDSYDLRLLLHPVNDDPGRVAGRGELVTGDITDLEFVKEACRDIDVVLHLAGNASHCADWDGVLGPNIIGTHNVFAAAKAAGCRKVIFASSIHAVSGYPDDVQVKTNDPVSPDGIYGVSKCFGEALARYFASQEDLAAIVLRIGAFTPPGVEKKPWFRHFMGGHVSARDLQQLIEKCIEDESLEFAIFHALSANRFNRLDISDAREWVGYKPQDDFFQQ